MSKVAYIVSNSGNVNLVIDGKSHVVSANHANYKRIMERLVGEQYDGIEALLDVSEGIRQMSDGKVAVIDGAIFYNGTEVINPLTDRILAFMKSDLPFKPMIKFLDNLMLNPSRTSVQELYIFMEHNTLPITDDGCFLAYKKVREDFKSFYASKDGSHMDHSVGTKPEMPRNAVDDKRDNVCSDGLHFCSLAYLPQYHGGSGKVIIVKINPKDVVSIPSDYNNAKGRACTYEVIAEHVGGELKEAFDKPLYDSNGGEYNDEGVDYEDVDGFEDGCKEDSCNGCHGGEGCGAGDNPDILGKGKDGYGIKPNGQDFNTYRSEMFLSNKPENNNGYGIKPSGQKFHNVRDSKGHFVKRT